MRELLIRLIDALTGAQGEASSPMASLERSIAAAGRAHIAARRALAVAIAGESREAKRRAGLAVDVERPRAARGRGAARWPRGSRGRSLRGDRGDRNRDQCFGARLAAFRRRGRAGPPRGRCTTPATGRSRSWPPACADRQRAGRTRCTLLAAAATASARRKPRWRRLVADNDDARAVRNELAPAEHLIERMSDAGFGEASRISGQRRAGAAEVRSARLCPFQLSSNPHPIFNKGITMSEHLNHLDRPTGAWISFSYISFAASLLLVGGGIFALPLDWWVRAYLAMGVTMVVQSSFTLAKNLRDVHEVKPHDQPHRRSPNREAAERRENVGSSVIASSRITPNLYLSSDTPGCKAGWLGPKP